MREHRINLDTSMDDADEERESHPNNCMCSECARYHELVAAFESDPTLTIEQHEAWEDEQHKGVLPF